MYNWSKEVWKMSQCRGFERHGDKSGQESQDIRWQCNLQTLLVHVDITPPLQTSEQSSCDFISNEIGIDSKQSKIANNCLISQSAAMAQNHGYRKHGHSISLWKGNWDKYKKTNSNSEKWKQKLKVMGASLKLLIISLLVINCLHSGYFKCKRSMNWVGFFACHCHSPKQYYPCRKHMLCWNTTYSTS